MRFKLLITALLFVFISQSALAQLDPFEDYDISDALWNITFIKVDPNMGDDYLEGLRDTWVAANKVAKELGQIEDYKIYRSQLSQSGDVTLFLVTKFANSEQPDPNQENYHKFMQARGDANQERTWEITKDYPGMREITGQYLVREITIK